MRETLVTRIDAYDIAIGRALNHTVGWSRTGSPDSFRQKAHCWDKAYPRVKSFKVQWSSIKTCLPQWKKVEE